LVSLHEELIVTFFIAKKVTKKSSRSKNSPFDSSNILFSWYAVSPISISRVPLFGFKAKKWSSCRLGQFRATGFLPIRDDFILITGNRRD
jgi:hypothetical protein